MRAFIFANGKYTVSLHPPDFLDDDLIIAVDGGSRHCQAFKVVPDILIGDLDSADPNLAASWELMGVEIILHPQDKDQTDLELALLLAQEREAEEAFVYGAVGGRLDMTFANLFLLAHPELVIPITLIQQNQEVHLLRPGNSLTLAGSAEDTLSLLPLHQDGAIVSAQGVQYPLEGENLAFGLTRGISNKLTNNNAVITLESGLLAVIISRYETLEEVS